MRFALHKDVVVSKSIVDRITTLSGAHFYRISSTLKLASYGVDADLVSTARLILLKENVLSLEFWRKENPISWYRQIEQHETVDAKWGGVVRLNIKLDQNPTCIFVNGDVKDSLLIFYIRCISYIFDAAIGNRPVESMNDPLVESEIEILSSKLAIASDIKSLTPVKA